MFSQLGLLYRIICQYNQSEEIEKKSNEESYHADHIDPEPGQETI